MGAFFLITLCIIATFATNVVNSDDGPFRGERSTGFDWNFTTHVFRNQQSNVVISPFSVKILLTLLYEASNEGANMQPTQTKKELQSVLIKNGDLDATRTAYRTFLDSALNHSDKYELEIATKFFVDEFIDVIKKYQSISYAYYNATVDNVPFTNGPKAADTINQWVSNTTHGRIKELVNADALDGVVIALVNAMYFKGLWTRPFPENGPQRTFYSINRKQVKADYMEQSGQFYYDDSKALGAQLLRLQYQGEKFAMYFILPNMDSTVNDVLSRITPQSLHKALWYMDETEVNVTIPKFKFDFSEELSEPLKAIGIREIFSANASLPLLARGKGTREQVRVSRVFQKAGIIVNEVGSEAYAATDIELVNKFGGVGTQIFNANRPFLFFIEDEHTGTMLFAGKVVDPTK